MDYQKESDMFELADEIQENAVIKVVGVGGGGGNAVEHMLASHIEGVEFICANTDSQALRNMQSRSVIQLGNGLTKGLGAGANPDIGRQAAIEDKERIAESIKGADMVFITAGMGGGTGTGAAPVVAEVAKEMGILTVAVVTKPFSFEGRKRMSVAEKGLTQLRENVDSLITVPNEKLLPLLGKDTTLLDAFKEANNVLHGAVQGIADLITMPGIVNVDFADVRTVMSEMGQAMMGSGSASGENRAREAAEKAIASPLLEDVSLDGARAILVNITAGFDLSLGEYTEVSSIVTENASEQATVVVGTALNSELKDELRITVVATGLGLAAEEKAIEDAKPKKVVDNTLKRADGSFDYEQIERPTHLRKAEARVTVVETKVENAAVEPSVEPKEYLDIPSFLRRQAD